MCWVAHRTLQVREQCVNSSFISFAQIGGERIENCLFESRLSLHTLLHTLPAKTVAQVRALEVMDPLEGLFPGVRPRLAVEVSISEPRAFELGRGFVRLGEDWLKDERQTERALIMGLLKRDQPQNYNSAGFQLEVMADFIMLTVMSHSIQHDHSLIDEVKFPTSAPSFKEYCRSPFRSLAHYAGCALPEPDSVDMQANVWGFRPLVAVGLYRMFAKSSLTQKIAVMRAIRAGETLPVIESLHDNSVEGMVQWYESTLHAELDALKFEKTERADWAFKVSMKELEVEAPTHWELTVDITNTPAWRDIVEQFRTWSRYHRKERTLIFTPEGALAFPSGLPVAWGKADIQTQKHVMIACQWPKPEDVVTVTARHVYARQSCGKVEEIFWN
jgi:hypothetical protein